MPTFSRTNVYSMLLRRSMRRTSARTGSHDDCASQFESECEIGDSWRCGDDVQTGARSRAEILQRIEISLPASVAPNANVTAAVTYVLASREQQRTHGDQPDRDTVSAAVVLVSDAKHSLLGAWGRHGAVSFDSQHSERDFFGCRESWSIRIVSFEQSLTDSHFLFRATGTNLKAPLMEKALSCCLKKAPGLRSAKEPRR